MYVKMPTTAAEFKTHQAEFEVAGLHGAGFSSDATNVIMWRCSHNLRQANMGFKQSHPARTYNLSCNHRRQILHSTAGHASRWNDKTLAYFDTFMSGIKNGEILQDVQFTLLSKQKDDSGNLVEIKTNYRGAWGIVDNGYHRWPCTQAPAKVNLLQTELRLTEWLESFRKNAECVFGILKGRFRVLKTGIRLDGCEAADNIWLTCCALHNFLLEADGLAEEWAGAVGQNDVSDVRRFAPFAMQRLTDEDIRRFGSRLHEREVMHQAALQRQQKELIVEEEVDANEQFQFVQPIRYDENGAVYINSLTYSDFRKRLVEHFDILYKKRQIKWPQR
jgi:DDE superfamily endonuclease